MPPAEPSSISDPTVVKDLFGMLLEAEQDGLAELQREAEAAMDAAEPAVRAAAQRLLEAHRRASGVLLEGGSASQLPADDAPVIQPRIAGYDIGEEIGRGGFGVVYRAMQLHPVQRPVAVKILRTELASPEVLARFQAESRVLAKMNHQGIARVLDAGIDSYKRPFVSMELVEGQSLLSYCETHDLSVRLRVQLMVEVCEAVHHAHQRAVIHRDLKPANILVEQIDGHHRPRVIDFGIAKILEENVGETRTRDGARMGTPRYMSPEQATGTETADVRSDVYAQGVLLCEVLTNSVPRGPAGVDEASGSRPKTRATRPSQLAAAGEPVIALRSRELRGDLDRIVLKAVALEPDDRYKSAAALADDLTRFLDGRPVLATPPGMVYLTRRFIARHRVVSAAIVLSALSLIAGTVAAMYGMARATENRLAVEAALVEAQHERSRAEAVAEFLMGDMLDALNPNLTGQAEREVTVLLRNVADEAMRRLANDPALLGNVLARLGRAMQTLTDFQGAAETLAEAARLSSASAGPTHPATLDLQIDALLADLSARRFDGAQQRIVAIRDAAIANHGPESPIALRAQLHCIHILPNNDVVAATRTIVEEFERHGYTDRADYLEALRHLGMAMYNKQDPQAAAFFTRASDLVAQRLGATNSMTIELRQMSARAAMQGGDLDAAEAIFHDVAQISERLYGPFNWFRYDAVINLMHIARQRGDHEAVHTLAQMRLEIASARQGSIGSDAAVRTVHDARLALAEALLQLQRFDQVDAALTAVLESTAPGDALWCRAVLVQASAMQAADGPDAARAFVQSRRDLLDADHPRAAWFDRWLDEQDELSNEVLR